MTTKLLIKKGDSIAYDKYKEKGGLRTKGYFKSSLKKVNEKWFTEDNETIDIDDQIIRQAEKFTSYPLVSVITVVFNGEKYLSDAIDSVLNQSYLNIEYLIIDGGSTDGTKEILLHYNDCIDLWISEKDEGIYDAMNKGIKLANGKIIALLNCDDFYERDAIEEVVKTFLSSPDIDCVSANMNLVSEDCQYLRTIKPDFKNIYKDMTICHPSFFAKRNIYDRKLFDLSYKIAADYEFILNVLTRQKAKLKYIDIITTNMRTGGMSSKHLLKSKIEKFKMHTKYFGTLKAIRNLLAKKSLKSIIAYFVRSCIK